MNDESVAFIPNHTFSELLQGPASGRMLGNVEVKDASRSDLHDHQHIDQSKGGGYDDEKVRGNDGLYMIPDESHPALRRNLGLDRHIATDRARRDLNPDFQQELVGDPLLAPRRVVRPYLKDQFPEIDGNPGPSTQPRLPLPEQS